MVFTIGNKKVNSELFAEYLKMRVKKFNIFKDLKTLIQLKLFFELQNFDISFMP